MNVSDMGNELYDYLQNGRESHFHLAEGAAIINWRSSMARHK